MQESLDLLLGGGYSRVTYHSFAGEGHGDCEDSHKRIDEFLRASVPKLASRETTAAMAAAANVPAQHKTVMKVGGRRAPPQQLGPQLPPPPPPAEEHGPQLLPLPPLPPPQQHGPQLPPLPPLPPPQQHGPQLPPPPPEHAVSDVDGVLRVVVSLPNVEGMSALDLSLSSDGLALIVSNGSLSALRLSWPRVVDVESAAAKFSKKTRVLTVQVR